MKTIGVFTGTRAEYGLLYWLMKRIDADPELELQLIVSGMHLAPEFGETWKAIEQDGFQINKKVEMLIASDSSTAIAKSMGIGTISYADALQDLNPDCLVLLGDRFEALAIAQAAMVMRIPIAHIHGGELTEGVIDEAIRHSITKMAHLHFTTTDTYRKRVIQLGESPERVFNTGAPAIENIKRMSLLTREELQQSIGLNLERRVLLATYHPVTLSEKGSINALKNMIEALEAIVGSDTAIVLTFPNADTHGRALVPVLQRFADQYPNDVLLTQSLGQLRYLSLMSISAAVVGNSSSGLLEAPGLHIPTVNIGIRQQGRLKPESVIDCDESTEAIAQALQKALSPEFQEKCTSALNPYGNGNVSEHIIDTLKSNTAEDLLVKPFYDLDFL